MVQFLLKEPYIHGIYNRCKEELSEDMEAGVGIEPTNTGFAVPCITTLLPSLRNSICLCGAHISLFALPRQ